MVFPEDTKDFVTSEMSENELKVLGSCCLKLNQVKATLLVNKRRKLTEMAESEEHELLVNLSRKFLPSQFLKCISNIPDFKISIQSSFNFH